MSNLSKAVIWNIWCHRYSDGIQSFLRAHGDTDVFCLTEVTDATQRQIEKNGHNLVFSGDEEAAQVDGLAQLRRWFGNEREIFYTTADYRSWKCIKTEARFAKVGFGSALAISSNVTVIDYGVHLIDFNSQNIKSRVVQWLVYQKGDTLFLLAHVHGVWIRGNTKGDHEARTHQSREIRWLLNSLTLKHKVDKVVFGGDLNLHINTNALNLIEFGENSSTDVRYRNLIREFSVRNTRTQRYREYHKLDAILYADYVFVSEETSVHSFEVRNDVMASDHAPLVVQFS